MKTREEFIEALVHIDEMGTGLFGHYPFQMVYEKADGGLSVAALCLGGDVKAVYRAAQTAIKEGAIKLFLSTDFPAGYDIKHDFIAVYSVVDNKLNCIAIPYDPVTGARFEIIEKGEMIDRLLLQFTH